MIREAVILAAGVGSRLGGLAGGRPKGFVEVGGTSLIERSLAGLFAANIQRVLIGTGHRGDCYEALATRDRRIICVPNPDYATTGSMSTLLAVAGHVGGDFLLLESDILYARRGLAALFRAAPDNLILASGPTASGDEVYIETSAGNRLRNLSKNRAALARVDGELVGITRIAAASLPTLCAVAESLLPTHARLDYETCLVAATAEIDIRVLRLDDYPWCEVDTAEHLARAASLVLPRIVEEDSRECP